MSQTNRVRCSCCAKQIVTERFGRNDPQCTIAEGAVADVAPGQAICGYCAQDLDENGLFPEEREDVRVVAEGEA